MEAFYINLQGIEIIQESAPQSSITEEGFKLFVLGLEEWDQVPLLWPGHIEQQSDWIKHLREMQSKYARELKKVL